jgi:lipid-A-disaccharide synthase
MGSTDILVVAGEASGDQHAASLVAELRARRPALRFFGMGGSRLATEGVHLLYDAHEISVMGITEVLPKIPRILKVLGGLARAARARRPGLAILVDVPDFNLRLARKLKGLGIPVAYYVSPMVWAWRPSRVKAIARDVDRMLCILPFEEAWYRERGVHAHYVGSPVLDHLPPTVQAQAHRRALGLDPDRPTLALLPGSRMSEVRRLLPSMVAAATLLAARRPGLQIVVPVAPTVPRAEVESRFAGTGLGPLFVDGRAPEAVGASDVAVVASGTATLEAGLMRRPLVVVYRVSRISWWVGRLLVKVAFVSLVNLLVGRKVVPELLQDQMQPARIAGEVDRLWEGEARAEAEAGLAELRMKLGEPGASRRAADVVLELLDQQAPCVMPAAP